MVLFRGFQFFTRDHDHTRRFMTFFLYFDDDTWLVCQAKLTLGLSVSFPGSMTVNAPAASLIVLK